LISQKLNSFLENKSELCCEVAPELNKKWRRLRRRPPLQAPHTEISPLLSFFSPPLADISCGFKILSLVPLCGTAQKRKRIFTVEKYLAILLY